MIQQKAIEQNKIRVRVQEVSAPGTDRRIIDAARQELQVLLDGFTLEFVSSDPLAILFVTGGSELAALEATRDKSHLLLMAFSRHNGFAAAAEVKACLQDQGVAAMLCNLSDPAVVPDIRQLIAVWSRVRSFTHKRIGLIGKVSDWLVASSPSADLLRGRFGIRLRIFPWEDLGHPASYPQSADFLSWYNQYTHPSFGQHSRVHTLLEQLVAENDLDGIAVECFSLVQQHELTACLSLARFNSIGIPAACEGDLVSLTGMMLIHQVTGVIPWMANLSSVFEDHIELSHCTISPNMADAVDVTTHFETGLGLAVQARLGGSVYTVFRWDQRFEQALIQTGTRMERPRQPLACRTQLALQMTEEQSRKYLHHPLGNHQLVLDGDYAEILKSACHYLNITLI